MAAEDERFEEWWKQKHDWLCYPIAQKQAAKAAWLYLEKKFAASNKPSVEICALYGKNCGYMRFNGACMGAECSVHPSRKLSRSVG
jgi:hypothetical protein